MTCSYCGTRVGELENRCPRCGRKPGDTLTGYYPVQVTTGNLAAQMAPIIVPDERPSPPPNLSGAVQGSLWPSKVVPIERYAPARPRIKPDIAEKPRATPRRGARVSENQTRLDFLPPSPGPKKLGTTVDAVICCDAPVATPGHRALASAIDWAIVLVAYALFMSVFLLLGGEIVLSKANLTMYFGAFVTVAMTYGLMWTIAGTHTAGMHCAQLRLTTFDGFPPDSRNRLLRFFGSCLSYCTVAGVLWSLVDEESLTWQDHISRTFPTYVGIDEQTFRRR
jgi:uncharacterized RDD family membrane protein YckC